MRLWLTSIALLASSLPAQLGLGGLADLARERAARQHPAQVEALKPFLGDLALAYDGDNIGYLDSRFEAIAGLGDGVVPLLLDYLTPDDNAPATLHRADNVARVLRIVGPADYCETLIELLQGSNTTARRNAIWLLGLTRERRAAEALVAGLRRWDAGDQQRAIYALQELGSAAAVPFAIEFLIGADLQLRTVLLRYLIAVDHNARALATVSKGFEDEAANHLLRYYIDYFAAHARQNGEVAQKLLPLIGGLRMPDRDEQASLVRALGYIAPAKHRATVEVLERVISNSEDCGPIESAAALALQELGDKGGVKTITKRFDQLVRRNKDDTDSHRDRGDWMASLERWSDAARDYKNAIDHSRSGAQRARLYLQIARCEAHRGKHSRVMTALKSAGVNRRSIESEARLDPVFDAILEHDSIQRLLKSLD